MLGGVELHLRLVAEAQARRGHRVTVLVTALGRRTARGVENGVEVIRAGRLATRASTPLAPALFRELRRLEPDVTHLHFPHPPGEVAQLLLGRSRATVMTWHSDIVRQRVLGRLYRPLMGRVLARTDLILPTSPRQLESSPVLSRLPARKCRVVPLGVDVERFSHPDAQRVATLRHGGPFVLFVGRLRYYKGVDVLIRAVERLSAANLLIAGRGPLEASWTALARSSPAARRIRFLGDVDAAELASLYAAADVFVLPSTERAEAYGLVQLEAMAAGTPAVSTELGTGTSFVNRDGETGLVVPPGDAEALASALGRLLGDQGLRRAMGDRARQRARREFSADRMLERLEEVYREVLLS